MLMGQRLRGQHGKPKAMAMDAGGIYALTRAIMGHRVRDQLAAMTQGGVE